MNDRINALEEQRAAAREAVIEAFDGDVKLAESWLHQPMKVLGNERPIDFMDSLERIQMLKSVIGKMEHGFP
jgi:uncharacterized protein (DUF2384 family)